MITLCIIVLISTGTASLILALALGRMNRRLRRLEGLALKTSMTIPPGIVLTKAEAATPADIREVSGLPRQAVEAEPVVFEVGGNPLRCDLAFCDNCMMVWKATLDTHAGQVILSRPGTVHTTSPRAPACPSCLRRLKGIYKRDEANREGDNE